VAMATQQKLGMQEVVFYFRTRFFLISACQRRLAPSAGEGEERCPSAPGGGRHATPSWVLQSAVRCRR
jgi:hypothetical protein